MIAFFRKIRQQLLSKNKTGKYLTYAIGEIVLVVIGILIALQINAWAIEQDNHTLEKIYLEALRVEIMEDIQFYTSVSDSLKNQETSALHILHFIEYPEAVIKDSLQFINAFRQCAEGENLTRTEVTWNELQSTGRMSLIRNKKLTGLLFEYYADLDHFASDFNRFPLEQRLLVRKFEHNFFTPEEHLDFFSGWSQKRVPRKTVFIDIRNTPTLYDLVKSVMVSSLVQKEITQKVLIKANYLQDAITKELTVF